MKWKKRTQKRIRKRVRKNNMDEIIKSIQESIKILNDHSAELTVDIAVLKSQVSELMWLTKVITTAFIVGLISQAYQLLLLKKNNKK